jgi:hypothetical protein
MPVPGNNPACAKQDARKDLFGGQYPFLSYNVIINRPYQTAFQPQEAAELVESDSYRLKRTKSNQNNSTQAAFIRLAAFPKSN